MKKTFVKVSILVLLLLLTQGCDDRSTSNGEWKPLTASGSIHAQDLRLAAEQGGRVKSIAVREGDYVKAGESLVVLESTPWELQLLPAEAAVTSAEAELDVILAGARIEEINAAKANLAFAHAKTEGAYTAWQNTLAVVDAPQEIDSQIAEAQMQVALAEQGVELAKAQLQPVQINRDIRADGSLERDIAEYQVSAAQHALAASEADLEMAQTLLDYLWWIRNEPLGYIAQAHSAEGQYNISLVEMMVAEAQLQDLMDGPTSEEITAAEAAVQVAEAEVNLLEMKIKKCTLVSPIDGVVIAQTVNIGELAAPAATILRLADLSKVTLEVFVPEYRIGHVFLDQNVSVTVDSYPDQTFEGRVTQIGNEPEFTPRNVATAEERRNTFYAVKIHIPNPDHFLKPGMPADAVFDLIK